MKTIEITLYKFEELSEETQQKAIENNYNINVDYDWWECIYGDAENVGLKITEFGLDRNKDCTLENIDSWHEIADKILKEHGEQCDTHKTAKEFLKELDALALKYSDGINKDTVTKENECDFDDECDDLEEEFKNSLSKYYAQMLQDESEYLMSDEAIKETLIASEYDFQKDGTQF